MSKEAHQGCTCGFEPCDCQCEKCQGYRSTEAWAVRLLALEKRLREAGIDVQDLADLIWLKIEGGVEAKIDRLAAESVKSKLKGAKLVSYVKHLEVT